MMKFAVAILFAGTMKVSDHPIPSHSNRADSWLWSAIATRSCLNRKASGGK